MILFMALVIGSAGVEASHQTIGASLTVDDFAVMLEASAAIVHIQAGVDAKPTRDAIVKGAHLVGDSAEWVYDSSKDVVMFTGTHAVAMASTLADLGMDVGHEVVLGGKRVLVVTGNLATQMAMKIEEGLGSMVEMTKGVVVLAGDVSKKVYAKTAEVTSNAYNSGVTLSRNVGTVVMLRGNQAYGVAKGLSMDAGTFVVNSTNNTVVVLQHGANKLLGALEWGADSAVKVSKAAYKNTKHYGMAVVNTVWEHGVCVVAGVVVASRKAVHGLHRVLVTVFGWMPKLFLGVQIGNSHAALTAFDHHSLLDVDVSLR